MAIANDELKELFENFQWLDDIPEDQAKRDAICLEAKAALLIEANCTSERFPAFGKIIYFMHVLSSFTSNRARLCRGCG